ncbi:hypothetical protein DSO57_1018144 [Entomophthora muscae]|uniref:Uncharacterized protein n=1 Tax=Entomophthora muscae TaxID=34485 RepID=A0ACC2U3V9_9FUNG|nr:hypothetical protein DSO57_1018144 [Entomophthora muscae]
MIVWLFLFGIVVCKQCQEILVRKNADDFSGIEKSKFLAAFRKLHAGRFNSVMLNLTGTHLHNKNLIHGSAVFLPWHRHFLHIFQKEIRKVDPSVVVPYWDWTRNSNEPHKSRVFEWLGSDGVGKERCVKLGGKPLEVMIDDNGVNPHCLRRKFDLGGKLSAFMGTSGIKKILKQRAFWPFAERLEAQPHASPHDNLGGDMGSMSSPNDPLFWLHHAMVDRIYTSWQFNNPNKYIPDSEDEPLPAFSETTVKDTLDTRAYPYCYEYASLMSSDEQTSDFKPTKLDTDKQSSDSKLATDKQASDSKSETDNRNNASKPTKSNTDKQPIDSKPAKDKQTSGSKPAGKTTTDTKEKTSEFDPANDIKEEECETDDPSSKTTQASNQGADQLTPETKKQASESDPANDIKEDDCEEVVPSNKKAQEPNQESGQLTPETKKQASESDPANDIKEDDCEDVPSNKKAQEPNQESGQLTPETKKQASESDPANDIKEDDCEDVPSNKKAQEPNQESGQLTPETKKQASESDPANDIKEDDCEDVPSNKKAQESYQKSGQLNPEALEQTSESDPTNDIKEDDCEEDVPSNKKAQEADQENTLQLKLQPGITLAINIAQVANETSAQVLMQHVCPASLCPTMPTKSKSKSKLIHLPRPISEKWIKMNNYSILKFRFYEIQYATQIYSKNLEISRKLKRCKPKQKRLLKY